MPSIFVLSTDHGTHPADKWAGMISELIFPISAGIAEAKMLAAKVAQSRIAEALEGYVQKILDHERQHLKAEADKRLSAPLDGHTFVEDALNIVYAITDTTQWADYMHKMEDVLRLELNRQFDSIQHVERLYHAENNQNSEAARAYRARFVSGE